MMMGEKADGGSRRGAASPHRCPPPDAPAGACTPLSGIAEAFEEMAALLLRPPDDGGSVELRLDKFCDACSLVSVLFGCLGLAFKFAEMEYVAKVRDLVEASKTHRTLQNILDLDVANDSVRTPGSHTRNLRRVRQGLDLIRALFEQFLSSDDYSLKDAATTAYTQVCAPFHTWAIRTAVYAGMYALPYRDQLLLKLNETGELGWYRMHIGPPSEFRQFFCVIFKPCFWLGYIIESGRPVINDPPNVVLQRSQTADNLIADKTAEKKMRRYIKASIPVIQYIDKLYISRNISLDW